MNSEGNVYTGTATGLLLVLIPLIAANMEKFSSDSAFNEICVELLILAFSIIGSSKNGRSCYQCVRPSLNYLHHYIRLTPTPRASIRSINKYDEQNWILEYGDDQTIEFQKIGVNSFRLFFFFQVTMCFVSFYVFSCRNSVDWKPVLLWVSNLTSRNLVNSNHQICEIEHPNQTIKLDGNTAASLILKEHAIRNDHKIRTEDLTPYFDTKDQSTSISPTNHWHKIIPTCNSFRFRTSETQF